MSQDLPDRSDSFRKNMLNTLSDAIFAVSAEGKILAWNRGAEKLTGYSRRDIAAMQPRDLFAASDRKRIDEMLDAVVYRGQITCEVAIRRRDGRTSPLELKASLMTHDDRHIICVVGRDMSSRNRALQALQESEQKFRALAENSTVGILLIQDGYLRYVNTALAHMYGYERDELIDRIPYEQLVHPDDREKVSRNIERRLEGKIDNLTYRFRGVTKTGKIIHIEGYGACTEFQERPAIVGTDRDITDRLRLQRELLRIQEDERRQIGRDLHDGVGTQLSAVSLLLRVLERDLVDRDPDLAQQLQQVRTYVQEADRNAKAISMGLNPVPLEKDGLAAALDRLAGTVVTADTISCTFNGENIPDLPGEVAAHLYWVAQAAVTHAVKYRDVEHLSIELTCSGTELALTVEDDGPGPAALEEPLNGLSLQKMQYRTELLGGTLTIGSDADRGTVVRCQIPIDSGIFE